MLFGFLDESYTTGEVHLIGALVVTPEQLHNLTLALDEVIWKTNRSHPEVPLDIELHGQQLYQRDGEWSCLRDKPAVAFAIYRRSIHAIRQAGGTWLVGGVRRIDRLAIRYSNPWPPHQIALQYALELVHEHAGNERVRVIADQVPDQAHHEARIRQFQLEGKTPGWKASTLSSIEQPFRWENSRAHRGLQAADLLTYVYMRKRFTQGQHPRAMAETEKLADLARPFLAADNIWTP